MNKRQKKKFAQKWGYKTYRRYCERMEKALDDTLDSYCDLNDIQSICEFDQHSTRKLSFRCKEKLHDSKTCNGILDYTGDYNSIQCRKCGRRYKFQDMAKEYKHQKNDFIKLYN